MRSIGINSGKGSEQPALRQRRILKAEQWSWQKGRFAVQLRARRLRSVQTGAFQHLPPRLPFRAFPSVRLGRPPESAIILKLIRLRNTSAPQSRHGTTSLTSPSDIPLCAYRRSLGDPRSTCATATKPKLRAEIPAKFDAEPIGVSIDRRPLRSSAGSVRKCLTECRFRPRPSSHERFVLCWLLTKR